MKFFAIAFAGMIFGYFLTEIGSVREEGIFDFKDLDNWIFRPTKTPSYFFRKAIKFFGEIIMIVSALLVFYGIYVVFVAAKASSCTLNF